MVLGFIETKPTKWAFPDIKTLEHTFQKHI